ncbi:MAG: cysteine desulfurase [Planctomycetota bacterium]|nr:MAG: cysteine desulfurase [Planctomycetota bacterium]
MPSDSLYLDFNSGAPMRPEVLEVWVRAARDAPANPASLHRPGRRAQAVVEEARSRVAELLRCPAREIVFTSGATEGNNLALLGAARGRARLRGAPPALMSSRAEHPSVLGPLRSLQQEGHALVLAPLDRSARADTRALLDALHERRGGILACQWANNETGAVQDLEALVADLPADTHFHCDAVQGFGKLPPPAALSAAHTLVLSAHKLGGPKGTGVLRVREDAFLEPVLSGGGQQRNLRPGTESPAAAAACAEALALALRAQDAFARHTAAACRRLLQHVREDFPLVQVNSPDETEPRLPNTLSLSFPGVDGRALLLACDAEGLALSSGSACASGAAQPSAVLRAAGLSEELARATLRVSFGWGQSEEEGELAAARLRVVLRRLYQLADP